MANAPNLPSPAPVDETAAITQSTQDLHLNPIHDNSMVIDPPPAHASHGTLPGPPLITDPTSDNENAMLKRQLDAAYAKISDMTRQVQQLRNNHDEVREAFNGLLSILDHVHVVDGSAGLEWAIANVKDAVYRGEKRKRGLRDLE